MKEPKLPRTVLVDHLCMGSPRKIGLFKKITICDYQSPEGIVREYRYPERRTPDYRVLKTKELVKVNFSFSMIEDMDDYVSDL